MLYNVNIKNDDDGLFMCSLNKERGLYLDLKEKTKKRNKAYKKELIKLGDDQLCDVVVDSYLSPILERDAFCVFNRAIIDDAFIDKIVRIELFDFTVLILFFDGFDQNDRSVANFKCLNPISEYKIKTKDIKTFSVLLKSEMIDSE